MNIKPNLCYKIICIKSCFNIRETLEYTQYITKGEIFIIEDYQFDSPYYMDIWIWKDGRNIGLYKKSNFIKLDEYRNNIINDIIDEN